mgnify:CR=1 FL=1
MKIEEINGNLSVVDFAEIEAYKIACAIEKEGMKFYKKLHTSSAYEKVREVLDKMIKEEEKHFKYFSTLLQEAKKIGTDNLEEDNLLQHMDYGVFQPYKSIAELDVVLDKPSMALKLAKKVEEKSVQFYKMCLNNLKSQDAKNAVKKILDEEIAHGQMFAEMLENMD